MSGSSPESGQSETEVRLGNAEVPGGLALALCRDRASIASLAPEWDDLLARSICNRAFGSSRWFLTWCAVEPEVEPRVFVARRGNELAGMLPMVEAAGGALRFPGELADYNDAIVARGDFETAAALLAAARASAPRLELSCIRPDANLAGALSRLEPRRDWAAIWSGPGALACPYAAVDDGYDAYLATRRATFRGNLRQTWRRAREQGLEAREIEPASLPPTELPALFLALHAERQPRTCFARQPERAFTEQGLPALFAERRLRAFAVFDGPAIVGISLCVVGDGSLGYWNGGFLASAARYGPGKLLFDTEIRAACREGLAELDLMRGDEAYKARWATGTRTIGRIELGPRATVGGAASAAGCDGGAAP